MSTEERKLAAIVFTDICGFTELMGRDESRAMALLEMQRTLLKPIVSDFDGEWLKEIGDGVLLSFPSTVKAVTCSLEFQRVLADNPDLTLRIGIHIGDVIKKGDDVFGDGVNIASRLEPLAGPGEIIVSERVNEDIKNQPGINSSFQQEHQLKGVENPIKVYSIFSKSDTPGRPVKPKIGASRSNSKIPFLIGGIMIGLMLTVFAVRSSVSTPVSSDRNSLAVFNFENLSAENENDRTGQILQELIITDLSGIRGFKIYSSQRLFDIQKQMGTKESRFIDPSLAMDIAKEAGAGSMMTGNIIKMGNKVVLTSRLLDVEDGSVIKSRKVEGDDIYAMVDKLSSHVIEDLQLGIIETVNMAVSEKTSSSMEAYKFYLTGVDLINEIKFKEAVSQLEKAVVIDPVFKEALYKLAIAQWFERDPETMDSGDSLAIMTLDRYLDLPDLDENEIKLGEGLKSIVLDKAIEAIPTFQHLTSLFPDNKEYWYMLGEAHYHGDKKYMQSLDAFERSVELDPEFTLSYEHIFDLYEENLLFDRAIRTSENLIKAFPEKILGYNNLSKYFRLTGKHEQAVKIIEQAIKISPENIDSYQRRIAINYVHMERYDDALRIIDSRLAKDIDNNNKIRMYDTKKFIFSILGEYSKCIELLQLQLDLLDDKKLDAVAIINRDIALAYHFSGNDEQANNYFQRSTKIIQENHGMYFLFQNFINIYYKAMIHVRRSDETSFVSEFDLFRSNIDQVNNPMISHYMEPSYKVLLFEKLAIQGKDEEALDLFDTLPIKEFSMEWVYYTAAKICIDKGEFKRALQYADNMQAPTRENWSYDIIFPRGHYIRGLTYESMGDVEKAKKSYNALLDLWKNADKTNPELIDTKNRLKNLNRAL
tara:strand:+ start:577 stop:3204 length:2628 start_codon:yes stop_codon:yes gene_type:complete